MVSPDHQPKSTYSVGQHRVVLWLFGRGLLTVHVGIFLVTATVLLTWNAVRSPGDMWVLGLLQTWGVILAFHAIGVCAATAAKRLLAAPPPAEVVPVSPSPNSIPWEMLVDGVRRDSIRIIDTIRRLIDWGLDVSTRIARSLLEAADGARGAWTASAPQVKPTTMEQRYYVLLHRTTAMGRVARYRWTAWQRVPAPQLPRVANPSPPSDESTAPVPESSWPSPPSRDTREVVNKPLGHWPEIASQIRAQHRHNGHHDHNGVDRGRVVTIRGIDRGEQPNPEQTNGTVPDERSAPRTKPRSGLRRITSPWSTFEASAAAWVRTGGTDAPESPPDTSAWPKRKPNDSIGAH